MPFERPTASRSGLTSAWPGLTAKTDLLNSSALIELVEPRTGRKWLALDGFSKRTGWGMRDGDRELQRDTWFRIRCFVVARAHEEQIANSLKDRLHLDGRSLPYMELPLSVLPRRVPVAS